MVKVAVPAGTPASEKTGVLNGIIFCGGVTQTPVVSQFTPYGDVVSSAPRLAPSRRNCTPTTPTLSVASAETATWAPAVNVLPYAGAKLEMAGGEWSPLPPPPVTEKPHTL